MAASHRLALKVLALLAAYPPRRNAGSWLMTHALLRSLVDRGHTANVVLTVDDGDPYELDGVRVWPRTGRTDPYKFLADADLVLSHSDSGSQASTLAQMCGRPLALVVHNTRTATELTLRRHPAALLVFNSRHMQDRFASIGRRSVLVRPPVHAADYATNPGDRVTLINLSRDKGAEVFWSLAERLPQRKFLGVVGGYGDQIVHDLPNVEVLDHVPHDRMRDEVYARTQVLLMPSLHESWGRTGIEAMASGIPVLASPTDGLCESLGAAGVFADVADVDGWERQLVALLDRRRWHAASRRARAHVTGLDPAAELQAWCDAVEDVTGLHHRRQEVRRGRGHGKRVTADGGATAR